MGILVGSIIRIGLQVLAGLGLGELLDKFVKPKVPVIYYPEPISPLSGGFKPWKILWFLIAFIAGIMLLKFIGQKLKIKLLR